MTSVKFNKKFPFLFFNHVSHKHLKVFRNNYFVAQRFDRKLHFSKHLHRKNAHCLRGEITLTLCFNYSLRIQVPKDCPLLVNSSACDATGMVAEIVTQSGCAQVFHVTFRRRCSLQNGQGENFIDAIKLIVFFFC